MGPSLRPGMDLVDTELYPLHEGITSAVLQQVVQRCRTELQVQGYSVLRGFLTASGIDKTIKSCRPLLREAHRMTGSITPYFGKDEGNPQFPPNHSVNFRAERDYSFVPADLIQDSHPLVQLYCIPALRELLAAIMEKPLYLYEDPFQTINLKIEDHGGKQPYHFDSADGTITIMLQNASSGGEIEAVPNALGNEDLIGRVLRGDRKDVNAVTYAYKPGSLVLFNGTKCLHRVKECKGPRERVIGIYQFGTQPNQKACIKKSVTLYGPQILDMLD